MCSNVASAENDNRVDSTNEETRLPVEQKSSELTDLVKKMTNANEINDAESGNILSNYIYLSNLVRSDLLEIDERLSGLHQLDISTPADEDYLHKKIRYFYDLNAKAKDEIIAFFTKRIIPFVLEYQKFKFEDRTSDQLTMLIVKTRYDYAFFRQYYDMNYDFSTEAKVRFMPGVTIQNMSDTVKYYIELHKNNPIEYRNKINNLVTKKNCLGAILEKSKVTYHLQHRVEIFQTLIELYTAKKYQAFIILAAIQMEGVFYDCCVVLNEKKNRTSKENFGTLVEKANTVFAQNERMKQAVYPYYAFEVPDLRNEIAHKGFSSASDLYSEANELILDLHTVVTWCYNMERDKYYPAYAAYKENIEKDGSDFINGVIATLFSSYQCSDSESVEVLAAPEKYSAELDFYKSLAETENGITIKEKVKRISDVVKSESFWNKILQQIKMFNQNEYIQGTKYNFVDFAIHLRNAVIPVLTKDSPEKLACQEVSKELKRFTS